MAIIDYKIIRAQSHDQLGTLVAAAITAGFQPFGAPVYPIPDGSEVAQALIKGTADAGAASAGDVEATAIPPGSATDVQGILAELAARIDTLEAAAT